MRIATWNLKQAVAPKKPLPELWKWASESLQPDCVAFTEAKVPSTGVPSGWSAVWDPQGVYPEKRNSWGTVLAGRGVELEPVNSVKTRWRRRTLEFTWPAAIQVADVFDRGEYWGTIVGLYAVTKNGRGDSIGNGSFSWPTAMRQLEPLIDSDRGRRLVVAGDLNLLPKNIGRVAESYGLTDVIDHTAASRHKLMGCISCNRRGGCHHLWTHKNTGGPNPSVQQVDYVFVSDELLGEVSRVIGGDSGFPDAWDMSDHAPVMVEFG